MKKTLFLTFILIGILSCNEASKKPEQGTDELEIKFEVKLPEIVDGQKITELPNLQALEYGMIKSNIEDILKDLELSNEYSRYAGAVSNLQLPNYQLSNTNFIAYFKFHPESEKLFGIMLKHKNSGDNEAYSKSFNEVEKYLNLKFGTGENKNRFGNRVSVWKNGNSEYELYFSEYDNPKTSFLNLEIKQLIQ